MKAKDKKLDEIADDILQALPPLYKRVMSVWCTASGEKQPHQYYLVLGMLSKCGPLSMSEIGRRLYISRPNATFLVNRLIKEGKLKREYDPKDRRVVKVSLTGEGEKFVSDYKLKVKESFREALRSLSDSEIEDLQKSLGGIKHIFIKLVGE